MKYSSTYNKIAATLWDLWCIFSVIGIWPRFIEPFLLKTTTLILKIQSLPEPLSGLKIAHFTDLHFSKKSSPRFLKKLAKKITLFKPDIILFTGDLISYGTLDDPDSLQKFLSSLSAPLGAFACLGNHDYEKYVSKNQEGNFDIAQGGTHFIIKSFEQLKTKKNPSPYPSTRAKALQPNLRLQDVFKNSSFQLLENASTLLKIKDTYLNITGLGDYWTGKCVPDLAFKNYNSLYPGIVLSHNPDTYPILKSYPGELIFSGHTHGGQVNLPWIWKYFSPTKNPKFKKGLFDFGSKKLYINRGSGSHHIFRWFSPPEILFVTLRPS
ncbi:MAG: UDP-2,3-diacylglucosamine diphosphatase LpxG [Chlamydiales bacterium]|nr:UDP-2,3-diacylglucosamine diphosphatase LpxG [Chlamydiales bacterium]